MNLLWRLFCSQVVEYDYFITQKYVVHSDEFYIDSTHGVESTYNLCLGGLRVVARSRTGTQGEVYEAFKQFLAVWRVAADPFAAGLWGNS